MKTDRIEALTDGIYAFAMTLLVLNFEVPPTSQDGAMLAGALARQIPQFIDYLLSFFLLAVFWIAHHHHFNAIAQVDNKLLWLNIMSLVFVVMIPFTTSLIGEYSDFWQSAVLFEINIFLIGFIYLMQWFYSTRKRKLVPPDLSDAAIRSGIKINSVVPVVSVLAILTALFSPDNSTYLYMTVPFFINKFRKEGVRSIQA